MIPCEKGRITGAECPNPATNQIYIYKLCGPHACEEITSYLSEIRCGVTKVTLELWGIEP